MWVTRQPTDEKENLTFDKFFIRFNDKKMISELESLPRQTSTGKPYLIHKLCDRNISISSYLEYCV